MDKITQLRQFLDKAHSAYHTVAELENLLVQAGYNRLQESGSWTLVAGGKYYLIRGGSAIAAFRVPGDMPKGFLISAGHTDRPCFQVKENGTLVDKYARLDVERYGGMLMGTWLDRPLSVAGRVMVETENGVESRLVDIDRDLLLIPNVAIHMNRAANDGYKWNPAKDLLPLLGDRENGNGFDRLLEETAGGKILGQDLYLYIRQKASVWGIEEEFISAQGLDDLLCVWGCFQGFLQSKTRQHIPVFCAFDSEEVGSSTYQGAGSDFLQSTISRVCKALNVEEGGQLARSFMVSADNGHALHPNHPELADSANAPLINRGVVVKFNANQRYTTTGASAAIFRKICQKADIPVQTYRNRGDMEGGSTLGRISLSQVGIPSVDIGLAQLAMHSCYETAGVKDVDYLIAAMDAYYSAQLEMAADGSCRIG